MHHWRDVFVADGVVMMEFSCFEAAVCVTCDTTYPDSRGCLFIVYVLTHSFGAHRRAGGLQMKQHKLIIDGTECVGGGGGDGGYSAYLSRSLLTAHLRMC